MSWFSKVALLLTMFVCAAGIWSYYHTNSNTLSVKTTFSRMTTLLALLDKHRPSDLSAEGIKAFVEYHDHPKFWRDGWGNPFIVEKVQQDGGDIVYQIRSLGKDGRLGECCRDLGAQEWDEDAVLLHQTWLQAWGFRAGYRVSGR